MLEEHGPEVGPAIEALVREAERSAEEHGPGSEAWQRYRHLQFLDWMGRQARSHQRRRRTPAPLHISLAPDPTLEARLLMSASEILDAPPPGEAIVSMPPDGQDRGRGRILLRIGAGPSSWVGSFVCGHTEFTTSYMMPDGKHLFVSAEGAGYIIDAQQRTFVEETGTEIVQLMRDEPMTMLIVNHGGSSLELFNRTGRLAREVPIECLRPPSE